MCGTELDCTSGTEKLLRAAQSKLPSPQLNTSRFYGNKPVLARPFIVSDVADTNVNRNTIYLPVPRYIINFKTRPATGSSYVGIKTHFEKDDNIGRSANRLTVKCNVLATLT